MRAAHRSKCTQTFDTLACGYLRVRSGATVSAGDFLRRLNCVRVRGVRTKTLFVGVQVLASRCARGH